MNTYNLDLDTNTSIPRTVFLSKNNTSLFDNTMSNSQTSYHSSQTLSEVSLEHEQTIEQLLLDNTLPAIVQLKLKEPWNDTTYMMVKYVTSRHIWTNVKFCPDSVINSVHKPGVKDSIMHRVLYHMGIQPHPKRNALFWNTYAYTVKKTLQDKRSNTVAIVKKQFLGHCKLILMHYDNYYELYNTASPLTYMNTK